MWEQLPAQIKAFQLLLLRLCMIPAQIQHILPLPQVHNIINQLHAPLKVSEPSDAMPAFGPHSVTEPIQL
jgi:hypothetical protein